MVGTTKRFFYDARVAVDTKIVPYSRKAMDLLISGKVDCAILVETNVAYLGYLKPKIPIKCLASVETRTADSILAKTPDSNANEEPRSLLRGSSFYLLIALCQA